MNHCNKFLVVSCSIQIDIGIFRVIKLNNRVGVIHKVLGVVINIPEICYFFFKISFCPVFVLQQFMNTWENEDLESPDELKASAVVLSLGHTQLAPEMSVG